MADRRPYTVCWRKARSRQELAGHAASIAKSEEELTHDFTINQHTQTTKEVRYLGVGRGILHAKLQLTSTKFLFQESHALCRGTTNTTGRQPMLAATHLASTICLATVRKTGRAAASYLPSRCWQQRTTARATWACPPTHGISLPH
jgi:hypothetical protein